MCTGAVEGRAANHRGVEFLVLKNVRLETRSSILVHKFGNAETCLAPGDTCFAPGAVSLATPLRTPFYSTIIGCEVFSLAVFLYLSIQKYFQISQIIHKWPQIHDCHFLMSVKSYPCVSSSFKTRITHVGCSRNYHHPFVKLHGCLKRFSI